MQRLEIRGGRKISGTVKISGSKNATLPILASTILTTKKITITNVPIVRDVETMVTLLSTIGSDIKFNKKKKEIKIFNKKPLKTFAPYYLLKTMRAGVLVLGSLLAKYRTAKVSLPGGCAIGSRPINLHLDALKKMGAAKIIISNRTKTKAEELKKMFNELEIIDWGITPNFDMVINATSIGLKNEDGIKLDYTDVGNGKFFYDVIYNPKETIFLKRAKLFGNKTENGKMMFIYQAHQAFTIWHKSMPEIDDETINLLD